VSHWQTLLISEYIQVLHEISFFHFQQVDFDEPALTRKQCSVVMGIYATLMFGGIFQETRLHSARLIAQDGTGQLVALQRAFLMF